MQEYWVNVYRGNERFQMPVIKAIDREHSLYLSKVSCNDTLYRIHVRMKQPKYEDQK